MSSLPAVGQDNFDAVVRNAQQPVLVDFWAEWCAPCRAITPLLEQIATQYAGKLNVVAVNVDSEPDITAQYGVRGIPALLLFNQGEVVSSKIGALSLAELQAFIDDAL